MKKVICLFFSLLFVLTLLPACGPAAPGETTAPAVTHTLSVGFGRADITPSEPVPLAGLNDNRMSTSVKDPIYATCVAFTDESGNSMIFYSIELLYAYEPLLFGASAASKKTGVPYANIMIGTTHSHAAPNVLKTSEPAIERYNEYLKQQMVVAAEAAMADLKPATMQMTTVYPENINSIRHYILADGTYGGDNFGNFSGNPAVKHVRDVDNSLQLVKFVREGGKDVIMMNWQGHPTGHGGEDRSKVLSWACSVTDEVEAALDCHCIYILGASGNVNNSSRLPEETIYTGYKARAKALAQYIIDAKDYQNAEVGTLQTYYTSCEVSGKGDNTSNKSTIMLRGYSIGDLALVAAPYEMFCENGEAVKEKSPFKMTFVSSCSNAREHYIPSISTYDYNNMPDEVYEISCTSYAPGTAEILEDGFVSILNELYKTKS